MLYRDKVEVEFLRLYDEYKYSTCAWAPLAGGILTGKYRYSIQPGTRFSTNRASIDRLFLKYYSNT